MMRPQIFGHRGSMATHPENTLPGFLHAMACGADGVELDVGITLDAVLVVTHDLTLRVDGREVCKHRAADMCLPCLDDVLALHSPENFWFDIEAKLGAIHDESAPRLYARLLSEAIRRSDKAHRSIVRSFDHVVLRAFHAVEPEIPLAALIEPSLVDASGDEWPSIARAAQASIVSPYYSTVTSERVRNAHDAGVLISAWTVNDPRDWDRMAALGVDTIITDDPCAAVRHFAGQGSE